MTGAQAPGDAVRAGLERVLERIETTARRVGRDPAGVTLIGVTKTVPVERIRSAVLAGLRHLGENRVQEAAEKVPALGAGPSGQVTWHLVGHLQSNKARRAIDLFSWIHSVDGSKLLGLLEAGASEKGVSREALIQVSLAGEPTKHGADPAVLEELVKEAASCRRLKVRGLMTIPPQFADPEASRPFFRRLRQIREELAARGCDLPELSMGMTNDFEVAIEEGATMVRVGRAIFGERSQPPGPRSAA